MQVKLTKDELVAALVAHVLASRGLTPGPNIDVNVRFHTSPWPVQGSDPAAVVEIIEK